MARTGAATRRSRSEWQHLVAKQRGSDLSDREFCGREDLTLGTFRWWRSQLRGTPVGSPAFLPVTVRGAGPASPEPSAVEILIQGDERRARMRADCPVELALVITAALRGSGPCS